MDSNNEYVDIKEDDIFKSNKRGDILYYSASQVASLLGEEDSSIRYLTNVFDDILKIEISNKELIYTNKDIDKLEFLISLKNKGMTIKEIQKYCEELPSDLDELVKVKENNSLSVKEIITTIVGIENKEINNLKEDLSNKIKEDSETSIQKMVNLIEEQEKQLKTFKDEFLTEIKQYIDCKFDMEHKINRSLYTEISSKLDNLISENFSLEEKVKLQFDKFDEAANSRDLNLVEEIRKFKSVIEHAYYVQQEMESPKQKDGFMGKLFGSK